jgi:hypothetical protein
LHRAAQGSKYTSERFQWLIADSSIVSDNTAMGASSRR